MFSDQLLIAHTMVSFTVPGQEPQQAAMGVSWASTDPAAITLTFKTHDGTVEKWLLSRDLFVDCMLADPGPQFGTGDAIIERGQVSFFLTLNGQVDGMPHEAHVTFLSAPIIELVKQSLMTVPRGEVEAELLENAMDAWLEEVLAGE